MRFWFAAAISPTAYGGIHRSMNFLATELRHYGHTTHLFFSAPGKSDRRLRFSIVLALKLLFIFWRRPQWIIARSSDGLFCALCTRFFHMKTHVVLHNHGWEERVTELETRLPAGLITNPTTWKARVFGFLLLRLTLRYASLCMCGTISEARWIKRRYPVARNKIVVVPNGVASERDPYWNRQLEKPPSFLMVGGFTWKKNLEYGIEIFRRFLDVEPAARLFIVGCGSIPEQKKQLLYPLGDAVFTVESELPTKMVRWYESCPMLLFPSRYEGGRPFTILEAQSKGCVVFAADIPAVRECITHGSTGFMLSGVNPIADIALLHSVYRNDILMTKISRLSWRKALRNNTLRQGQRLARSLLVEKLKGTRR